MSLYGQMLDNSKGEAFTNQPYFNETFIKNNKIKRISGAFTLKKAGDIMRKSKLKRSYMFNENGQLYLTYETTQTASGKDTLVTYYDYDTKNRLITTRSRDQYGFYATHFSFDDEDRVIRKEQRRSSNSTENPLNFELSQEFIVNFETASYQQFDNQLKKTVYNSYDIPYKEVIYYYDEDKVLIEEVERLKRTSATISKKYYYNDFGYIDSLVIHSPRSRIKKKKYTYTYDNHQNLTSKKYYKDDAYTTEHQVIYDPKTTLLKYILTREVATDYITILDIEGVKYY